MNTQTCPICGSGKATLVREVRQVEYGKRRVSVDEEFMRCADCKEAFYLPGQMEQTDRRAAAEVRRLAEPPLPFEIRNLRAGLHLSQTAFEKLLNTGPKTAVRWEMGTVIPNSATGTLLRVLQDVPEAVPYLAALHDVELRPAYNEDASHDVTSSIAQEYSIPVSKNDAVRSITPYLQKQSGVQGVPTPLSPAVRTFKESTG